MGSEESVGKVTAEVKEEGEEDGFGRILDDIDEIREKIKAEGGLEKTEAAAKEEGLSNRIYIDFSQDVDSEQATAMGTYLTDFWNIPVDEKEYTFTGVWAERWILVLDDADWSYYLENQYMKKEGKSEKDAAGLRGHHYGYGFRDSDPEPEEHERRSYCLVSWGKAELDADVALFYNERTNPGVIKQLKDDKKRIEKTTEPGSDKRAAEKFRFLTWDEYVILLLEDWESLWENAAAKIAAWVACHELSHALWYEGDKAHPEFFFESGIHPLEILLYYEEMGRKLLFERREKDVKDFYGFFGEEKWQEKRIKEGKPIRYR
ncbi:MAG: hypothetical protein V3W11_07275 [bacterium]